MKRNCDHCGKEYNADNRNVKRGWGLCCSKSCAASKREKSKPNYDPVKVAQNNILRESWISKDENEYGIFKGRYTSEGYRIYESEYGNTAINKYGEPEYTLDNTE